MPLEDFYDFTNLIEEHYKKEKEEANGNSVGQSGTEPKPIGAVIPRQ